LSIGNLSADGAAQFSGNRIGVFESKSEIQWTVRRLNGNRIGAEGDGIALNAFQDRCFQPLSRQSFAATSNNFADIARRGRAKRVDGYDSGRQLLKPEPGRLPG
jgi:hypothetical protein